MTKLRTLMARIRGDENGATAIEYGLLAALIAVVLIAGATLLGNALNDTFDEVAVIVNSESVDANREE